MTQSRILPSTRIPERSSNSPSTRVSKPRFSPPFATQFSKEKTSNYVGISVIAGLIMYGIALIMAT